MDKIFPDASATNLYTSSPFEEEGYQTDEDDEQQTYNKGQIDFSDFIELIPKDEVQGIVSNYLQNDEEVRHAYSYLQSIEFSNTKQQILRLPEMEQFLKFANQSGFDVLSFLDAIFAITAEPTVISEYIRLTRQQLIPYFPLICIASSTITPRNDDGTSMKGLTGLVDSILDVLPQDQILSLFFDKLENNEEFSYLVKNVGSEKFSKILQRMGVSEFLVEGKFLE